MKKPNPWIMPLITIAVMALICLYIWSINPVVPVNIHAIERGESQQYAPFTYPIDYFPGMKDTTQFFYRNDLNNQITNLTLK